MTTLKETLAIGLIDETSKMVKLLEAFDSLPASQMLGANPIVDNARMEIIGLINQIGETAIMAGFIGAFDGREDTEEFERNCQTIADWSIHQAFHVINSSLN